MSDFLCLRFRDTAIEPDAAVAWTIVSASAQIEDSGHALLGNMAQTLPESDVGRRCIVIVGSESVLLTSVELPTKQQRHMKQLVPFLVEEQIIDPIESMHLAMPVLHHGDAVTVAAVKSTLLAHWLDQLQAVNIAPDYLFIDVFCVPDQQGQWQLLFDQEQVLFRDGNNTGMRLDRQTAPTVIKLAIQARTQSNPDADTAQASELEQVALIASSNAEAERVALRRLSGQVVQGAEAASRSDHEQSASQLAAQAQPAHDPYEAALLGDDYVNPADVAAGSTNPLAGRSRSDSHAEPGDNWSDELTDDASDAANNDASKWLHELGDFIRSENIETKVVNYSETVSQLLAVSAVQSLDRNLNLLQGEFRPATANAANRRYMRKVSVAVAACVALFLLITLGGGAFLNYRADNYFDQSVAIYRSLFPQQRKVRDPVKQLQRQLRGNAVGGTTSDFLPLLDAASRSLTNLETGEGAEPAIKQLRYDIQRGHIAIDLHASNIDQLEAYRDLLAAEGLDVDILSANQDGDTIKGRIQVGRS